MAAEFTEQQLGAIEWRSQDACVTAGPGSGKTTVLVERYRQLVQVHGIPVSRILAITFTEKAAANMRAKLAQVLAPGEIEQAWVSTIHGFCMRLLRENAIAAGVDPKFQVLDARDAESMQRRLIEAALDELTLSRREEALRLIDSLKSPATVARLLQEAWDAMRSAGQTAAQVRAMQSPLKSAPSLSTFADTVDALQKSQIWKNGDQRNALIDWVRDVRAGGDPLMLARSFKPNLNWVPKPNTEWRQLRDDVMALVIARLIDERYAPERSLVFDALERFEQLYAEAKRKAAVLDFNDLERLAIRLLSGNKPIRESVRAQFRQVMLDEFQDINHQQQQLMMLVRGEDVFFGVGDRNQSIYGFRHARPEIFDNYRAHVQDTAKHSAALLHNFRSREPILRFVEAVLNRAPGIDSRELTAGKRFAAKSGPSVEIIRAVSDESDVAELREGRWIARRIDDLQRENGFEYSDFAVLCRSREAMEPVLQALVEAGIPHVCGRRESFLVSREGLDLRAVLHAIANRQDRISSGSVLRSPFAGLSDEALLRIRKKQPLDAEDREKLALFEARFERWQREQPVTPPDVLIARILTDCGMTIGGDAEAFIALARSRGADRTLPELLREIESMADDLATDSVLSDEDQGNRVQVMTAHASKGLEYKVVFVAAMHKGVQPGTSLVTFTPDYGLGLAWGPGGDLDSWGRFNKEAVEDREEAEANRLLYVAMTRAEEHLVLSFAYAGKKRGDWSKHLDTLFDLKESVPANRAEPMEAAGVPVLLWHVDQDPPLRPAPPARKDDHEAEEVLPLPDTDQSETAVNVTALKIFAECPRKYYIRSFTGWQRDRFRRFDPEVLAEAGGEGESGAELGTAVHEILSGKTGEYSEEARRLADVFANSELGRRAAAASRREHEWEFAVDVDGIVVGGKIDLWFEEDGEIHVVDYKTDASAASARSYAPQLALYGHAIERAFGRAPKSASLHFLKSNVVERVELPNARDLVARLRDAQSRLRFERNAGPQCQECEFHVAMCPGADDSARSGEIEVAEGL